MTWERCGAVSSGLQGQHAAVAARGQQARWEDLDSRQAALPTPPRAPSATNQARPGCRSQHAHAPTPRATAILGAGLGNHTLGSRTRHRLPGSQGLGSPCQDPVGRRGLGDTHVPPARNREAAVGRRNGRRKPGPNATSVRRTRAPAAPGSDAAEARGARARDRGRGSPPRSLSSRSAPHPAPHPSLLHPGGQVPTTLSRGSALASRSGRGRGVCRGITGLPGRAGGIVG